jgi:hypothetical protein
MVFVPSPAKADTTPGVAVMTVGATENSPPKKKPDNAIPTRNKWSLFVVDSLPFLVHDRPSPVKILHYPGSSGWFAPEFS